MCPAGVGGRGDGASHLETRWLPWPSLPCVREEMGGRLWHAWPPRAMVIDDEHVPCPVGVAATGAAYDAMRVRTGAEGGRKET